MMAMPLAEGSAFNLALYLLLIGFWLLVPIALLAVLLYGLWRVQRRVRGR